MLDNRTVLRTLKSRLIKGSIWAFAGKLTSMLAALAGTALLARLLTPDDMGTYFLAFSMMSIAVVLAKFGLNRTVVRFVAEELGAGFPGRAVAVIKNIFLYGTLSTITVTALLTSGTGNWIALRVFDSPTLADVITLITLWMIVITFRNLQAETFRAFHDIRFATIFGDGLTRILLVLLLLGLWLAKGDAALNEVLWLSILAASMSVLGAAIPLKQKISHLKRQTSNGEGAGDSPPIYQTILATSWPLFITDLTLFLLKQADILIIGASLSQEEVAIYGVATRLVLLVATPLLIINAVVPPIIAELHTQSRKQELEGALRATATVAGTPALIVLLIFIFWGEMVLELVYGGHYRQAANVLALLSFGQLINVWAGSCGLVLMMTGYQTTMMRITAFSGLFVVAGAITVAKQYGTTGVAIITVAGMILQNVLMVIFAKRKTGIWTHAKLSLLRPKTLLTMLLQRP